MYSNFGVRQRIDNHATHGNEVYDQDIQEASYKRQFINCIAIKSRQLKFMNVPGGNRQKFFKTVTKWSKTRIWDGKWLPSRLQSGKVEPHHQTKSKSTWNATFSLQLWLMRSSWPQLETVLVLNHSLFFISVKCVAIFHFTPSLAFPKINSQSLFSISGTFFQSLGRPVPWVKS